MNSIINLLTKNFFITIIFTETPQLEDIFFKTM